MAALPPRMDKPTQHSVRLLAGLVLAVAFALAAAPGAHASCAVPGNEIEAENCCPAPTAGQWDVAGAGDPRIQGFATDISVPRAGGSAFKVDTTAASYRLDIYRIGYYGGGARGRTIVTRSAVRNEDACPRRETALIDCSGWGCRRPERPRHASGMYFAKPVAIRRSSHVVSWSATTPALRCCSRPRTPPGRPTTSTAAKLYGGNPVGAPTRSATTARSPRAGRSPEDWLFNAEYPMVRFLERTATTSPTRPASTATARRRAREHNVFLSVGHDEYWSGAQRANVEAARNAGVHLAFFSGNEIFWKTRWERSTANTPYRRCLVQGDARQREDRPEPNSVDGTWRDPRSNSSRDGGQPENALTGRCSRSTPASGATPRPAEDGKLRLWRRTPWRTAAPAASRR